MKRWSIGSVGSVCLTFLRLAVFKKKERKLNKNRMIERKNKETTKQRNREIERRKMRNERKEQKREERKIYKM